MRTIWKGTISFGLVNIPVGLAIATQRSDPRFRTLDAESLQPIRQQLYSPAREAVVERDETVRGFEVAKDRYVVLTDEELESVAVERRRTIDITAFVDREEVDPVYYDRTYYLQPQQGAEKPYGLLVAAMERAGKAAIGKLVLSSKEHLVLLRPSGRSLAVELLFYPEDVRSKAEIEERMEGVQTTDAELDMAVQLIESMAGPFEPEAYENEHKRELMALIERKAAGEAVEVPPEAPAPAPVPDLMSALKASLEQAKAEAPAKPKRRGRAKAETDGSAKQPARKSKRKAPAQ